MANCRTALRSHPVRATALAVGIAVLLAPSPPQAAPAATALTRFEQGAAAFDARKYDEALRLFQASLQLESSPNTRLMIGRCQHALGRIGSAYTAYRRAAKEAEDRIRATADRRYVATREAAEAKMAELAATVPRLTIQVADPIPPGFYVTVDGTELAAVGLGVEMELDVGEHQIIALGPRVERVEQRVTLALGQRQQVTLPIRRIETGVLQLVFHNRPAGAAISLDGKSIPPDVADKPQYVTVGEHRLEGAAPGYRSLSWQGRLGVDQMVRLPIHFVVRPVLRRTPQWLFFTIAGASLAALGVGIGLGVSAQAAQDDQLAQNPLLRDPAVRQDIQNHALVANVMFGTAATLGIATAVLAFTTGWRAQVPSSFTLQHDANDRQAPPESIAERKK